MAHVDRELYGCDRLRGDVAKTMTAVYGQLLLRNVGNSRSIEARGNDCCVRACKCQIAGATMDQ